MFIDSSGNINAPIHFCSAIGRPPKEDSNRKTLGEQAVMLKNVDDRLLALRRTTTAMQVLLARSMVMRALSLLSVR